VAELREVVEQQTQGSFTIGDRALEIEPMRERGRGQQVAPGQELFTVSETLHRLAEDIGLAYRTVEKARWTASRWPKDKRQKGVSFRVHRVLAQIADEAERFATITKPPAGKTRWTSDEANRKVGRQVERPTSPQEKITAIHHLARDEDVAATVTSDFLKRPTVAAKVSDQDKVRVVEEFTRDEHVATQVTTGLLRRPEVAFKAMSDDTARHQVNHAQVERGRQAREHFEDTSPVAPAVRNIDRTVEFLDLVTACHSFVAAAGRPAGRSPVCAIAPWARTNARSCTRTWPRCGRRSTGSRPPSTPARSTWTASWPACCGASSRGSRLTAQG
jgi:hypothetical protein